MFLPDSALEGGRGGYPERPARGGAGGWEASKMLAEPHAE